MEVVCQYVALREGDATSMVEDKMTKEGVVA